MNSLEHRIAKGEIEEVISILFNHFYEEKNISGLNSVIMISAKWNRINHERVQGIINLGEYSNSYSQIVHSLTSFVLSKSDELPSVEMKVLKDENVPEANSRYLLQAILFIMLILMCVFLLIGRMNSLIPSGQDSKGNIGSFIKVDIENLGDQIFKDKEKMSMKMISIDTLIFDSVDSNKMNKESMKKLRLEITKQIGSISKIGDEISEIFKLVDDKTFIHNGSVRYYIAKRVFNLRVSYDSLKRRLDKMIVDYERKIYDIRSNRDVFEK